jgi:hypothetical protein
MVPLVIKQLHNESTIGVDDGSNLHQIGQGLLEGDLVLGHEVGQHNGGRSGGPHDAVHEDVAQLPGVVDELQGLSEAGVQIAPIGVQDLHDQMVDVCLWLVLNFSHKE